MSYSQLRGCILLLGFIPAFLFSETKVDQDLIENFAPRLRFDSLFGQDSGLDSKCFPSSAAEYFQERRNGVKAVSLITFLRYVTTKLWH